MEKIEMPYWYGVVDNYSYPAGLFNRLENWFNENLKGKYIVDESELVEVFTQKDYCTWFTADYAGGVEPDRKAYLVGIEPIKRETREEKLERILGEIIAFSSDSIVYKSAINEAKAALEREGE